MENEQIESPTEETQPEDQTQVNVQEQVKALLADEPEPVAEPEKTEPEIEPEKVEPVVTDEMIDKYPSLKMFRGKKLEDLTPIYDKLVRKYQNEIRLRKELEGKLEKTSLNELGEPPDYFEEGGKAKFDAWLKKRDELIRSQVKQPEPEVNYLAEVQKRLPNVDVEKVANDWAKYNSRRLFDETGTLRPEIQALYQRDPELMIEEITNFYELSSKASKNEVTIEQEAKKQAYQKTKDNFKEARKTKKESSEVHSVSRTTELTPEDELLQKIYNSAFQGT